MKKIIVGVSGGADSMALLDMLYKANYDIVVAHVNYQVREESFIDQAIVESYCQKLNIKFEVLDNVKYDSGNFQHFARNVRYDFMVELYHKYNASAIYVAHHLDDLIETYIMQNKRGNIPLYYGLNKDSKYKGVSIKRILLDYSKEDLIKYCLDNNIEYVDDKSNFENKYTRNLIRNTLVSKLNKSEKKAILEVINQKNKELQALNSIVLNYYNIFKEKYSLAYLLTLDDDLIIKVLRMYLSDEDIYNISNKEFENILNFIKSDNNSNYRLLNNKYLMKSYDLLNIVEIIGEAYSYTFDKIEKFKCEYFEISDSGTSFEGVYVSESDFPITIRSFKQGDKIKMLYGTKKVSRFFIDNKIPQRERNLWPIVLNADNEIILVPKIGPNVTHYSNTLNMFVVK